VLTYSRQASSARQSVSSTYTNHFASL